MACRILVPQSGIEPVPLAVEAWSLNHCTSKEDPKMYFQSTLNLALCIILVKHNIMVRVHSKVEQKL